jgi:hypothetical protein
MCRPHGTPEQTDISLQQEAVAAVVWQWLLINGSTSPSVLTVSFNPQMTIVFDLTYKIWQLVEAVEGQVTGMDALHIDLLMECFQ